MRLVGPFRNCKVCRIGTAVSGGMCESCLRKLLHPDLIKFYQHLQKWYPVK